MLVICHRQYFFMDINKGEINMGKSIVISASKRNKVPKIFGEMFQFRHKIFKEKMDWDVPSNGGQEFDKYDELDAYYITAVPLTVK